MKLRKVLIDISTKHDLLYRIFIVVLSIIVITNFLPHQVRFKYDYKAGGKWNYEDLKAPFDFPIYKSDNELETEKK